MPSKSFLSFTLSFALIACSHDHAHASPAPKAAPAPAAPVLANAQTAKLSLGQKACAGCVKAVRGALAGIDGVGEVDIKVGDEDFSVAYDPAKIQPATLVEKLKAAGESKVALK